MSNPKTHDAVCQAVFWAAINAASGAAYDAAYDAVFSAVGGAMYDAGHRNPTHPALQDFLRFAGVGET